MVDGVNSATVGINYTDATWTSNETLALSNLINTENLWKGAAVSLGTDGQISVKVNGQTVKVTSDGSVYDPAHPESPLFSIKDADGFSSSDIGKLNNFFNFQVGELTGSYSSTLFSAGTGHTKMEAILIKIAQTMNKLFEEIMAIATMMSTGEMSDDMNINADIDRRLGGIGAKGDSSKNIHYTDNLKNKVDASEIMESPGTLFLIQQVMSQMKDALQAVGAVGKVIGDTKSQAMQSFARNVAQ